MREVVYKHTVIADTFCVLGHYEWTPSVTLTVGVHFNWTFILSLLAGVQRLAIWLVVLQLLQ